VSSCSSCVDVTERFRAPLASLADEGWIQERTADRFTLTREGLLRVDVLLRRFFLPEHRDIRYT
jgi:hypothetical protein